jgi:hypothetical protein
LKKHLRIKSGLIAVLIAAALLPGCGEEKTRKDFVARVNNTYLTKDELAAMIDTGSGRNYYKNEIVRNWINKELLYQEAEKEGILNDETFKRLLNSSKKELAAALLVQKYYEDQKVNLNSKEVENYFEDHINDFRLSSDSYLINLIEFSNEDKAVRFRNTVIESDWEKALNIFRGDTTVINSHSKEILAEYQIHPASLLRIITALEPKELSIVINYEHDKYAVIQEIDKFPRDSVPPFDAVKLEAGRRLAQEMKEQMINSYIQDLYSNNDIEVKNQE